MPMPVAEPGGWESTASGAAPEHVPVLLHEAVAALQPRPRGIYIDGTFGAGGHSGLLAERIGAGGRILAFDRDPAARERAEALDRATDCSISFVAASYATMADEVKRIGLTTVDGVLLDLGLSSLQLGDSERGFSFLRDGRLDMRFDTRSGETAADLVARLSARELADILFHYGDERQSRRISAAIVRERAQGPIRTTGQLATLVERTVGRSRRSRIHPATRTFQALRIAVNDELGELERGLEVAVGVLAPGARLVAISFHSLEDRVVKRFVAREVRGCICPPEQPVCTCGRQPTLQAVGRPVRPSDEELARNPRARSAIMRVAARLP